MRTVRPMLNATENSHFAFHMGKIIHCLQLCKNICLLIQVLIPGSRKFILRSRFSKWESGINTEITDLHLIHEFRFGPAVSGPQVSNIRCVK